MTTKETVSDACRQKVKIRIGNGVYVPADGDAAEHIAQRLHVHQHVIEAMIEDGTIVVGDDEADNEMHDQKGAYGGTGGMVRRVITRTEAS